MTAIGPSMFNLGEYELLVWSCQHYDHYREVGIMLAEKPGYIESRRNKPSVAMSFPATDTGLLLSILRGEVRYDKPTHLSLLDITVQTAAFDSILLNVGGIQRLFCLSAKQANEIADAIERAAQ